MNILFVCTGNTCRSAMAQAIAKQLIKGSNKSPFNLVLMQIRRDAGRISAILTVAPPGITTIFGSAMPDLPAIVGSTLTTNNLGGKRTVFV